MGGLGRSLTMCAAGLAFSVLASAQADHAQEGAAKPGYVQVQKVELRLSPMGPAVLLRVRNRVIPVIVDSVVAQSIQGALTGRKLTRPLSHDLMHSILQSLDAKVSQVVVTFNDGIFYGSLTVVMRDSARVFDSRSSDAIALAIHFKAPILVSQELLDSTGIDLPEADAAGKQ
jgi:bifunctional DNase/RNase